MDLTIPSSFRSSSHFTATSCDPDAAMAPDNIVGPADPGHAATITQTRVDCQRVMKLSIAKLKKPFVIDTPSSISRGDLVFGL